MNKSQWHEDNKERTRAYQRAYRKAHPDKAKTYRDRDYAKHGDVRRAAMRAQYAAKRSLWLLRTYGVTEQWYAETLAAQGTQCAICGGTKPGGRYKVFHIDHDHATGRIRGLLCSGCNHLLGQARDSVAILGAAIGYLQKACQYASMAASEAVTLVEFVPDQ